MTTARVGLLTGPVGVGKTTIAERLVGLLRQRGLASCGLLAPAMMDSCGRKVGIWAIDVLSAERQTLARTDRDLGGPSVGPYSFDAAALDWAVTVVDQALRRAAEGRCDLAIVDEIGRLELYQDGGLAPVLPLLASGKAGRVLVLVRDSLLAELEARLAPAECIVFEASEENRRELPTHLVEAFVGRSPAPRGPNL
jgi:nucleoside-triphosphatase THEP1